MGDGPRSPLTLVRCWVGIACVLVGVALPFGFLFVPPQVLIPELLRNPQIQWVPEGLVGLWLVGIGALLVLSAIRSVRKARP